MVQLVKRGAAVAAALALTIGVASAAVADSSAAVLPPEWHIHDGLTSLGPQHKGVGFFPTILGETASEYSLDPAMCPNATDKAFLPSSGSSESPLLRAGVCMTSVDVIQLRTVRLGTAGPDGWSSITVASEPGWITYYQITAR